MEKRIIYKSYKFRLYPEDKDKDLLAQHFGHCRFIYNYFLKEKQDFYLKYKKTLNYNNCSATLTALKKQKEYSWLKDVNSQSLQQSLKHLETAFGKFFKKEAKFPVYKSKHSFNSFSVPQNINIIGNRIFIPKFKQGIRFIKHRDIKGTICGATVSLNPSGRYFISILTRQEVDINEPAKNPKIIGIDLGIKDFLITSGGSKFPSFKFQREYQTKLSKLQRHLSRKSKICNSKKRTILKQKIAKLHEKIANSREYMQHRISKHLIMENDIICLETLSVKNMMENHKLAYAISDASWASFVSKLEYKAKWNGKDIVKIEHFFPSSKTCNNCGYINKNLKLRDRIWKCPKCGKILDRDINAAKNILNRGLTIILSSATDDYRHGAEIRLKLDESSNVSISEEVSKID